MVSALDSGASAPGSSPGRGHCVVFLVLDTLLSVSLSTQVEVVTGEFNAGGNPGLASHPGGSRNTPSRFMLQKPG